MSTATTPATTPSQLGTDLSSRRLQPELMDDPSLPSDQHRQALVGLARIHRLTFSATRFWRLIKKRFVMPGCQSLTVMDVGCGDAFVLRQLYQLARRDGVKLSLIGCDISETALAFARSQADYSCIPLKTARVDVLENSLPTTADIVISSLFLHHFPADEVVQILKSIHASAARGAVIEDLRRTQFGYGLCWLGTRLLSRSPIVHTDGLLSVQAAFSISEINALVETAKILNSSIENQWPERFMLSWSTDGARA